MDAIKQYMQPKWWLIVVGAIFTIFALLTYMDGDGAAETGWGNDYTANDVFYEKAWGANVLMIAIIALVSGFLIKGRALSIIAMTIAGVNILSFILVYLAAGDLEYGFLDPSNAAPPMVIAVGLFLSGYLHLED